MDIYAARVEDLPESLRERITVYPNVEAMNRALAAQFCDLLAAKADAGEILTVIAPVGPVQYRYFAQELNRRKLSARNLRTINMDEYLDEHDKLIPLEHPLSFRRHMKEAFFDLLPADRRPAEENVIFPDPDAPRQVTELIDAIGGADLCWCGFGITGHLAFNDPPQMLGEPVCERTFRQCKTRKLTIAPMTTAQMALGGTDGNVEIIPTRAVTIGMYELLKTKRMQMTMMRNWHAGLWRRAFLGPVTCEFPGSLLQEHPNVRIAMTALAAQVPGANATMRTGEETD